MKETSGNGYVPIIAQVIEEMKAAQGDSFSLEKKYIYADVKARKEYRQNVVLPLLEEYFAWLKSIHPEKGSKCSGRAEIATAGRKK